MTLSHTSDALPYVAGLIFLVLMLCWIFEPFPADEPEVMDLGEEWK